MRFWPVMIAVVALGACTTLPDVPLPDAAPGTSADYPDFVPMRRVALQQARADTRTAETEDALEARVARLRNRAARLRNAAVD